VLGAKRLVQATLDAEQAINSDAVSSEAADLAPYFQAVRQELAQTLAQARQWLEAQSQSIDNNSHLHLRPSLLQSCYP
jgi:hypothetical protein